MAISALEKTSTAVLVLALVLPGCSPDNSLAQHGLGCGKPAQPACRVSFRLLRKTVIDSMVVQYESRDILVSQGTSLC